MGYELRDTTETVLHFPGGYLPAKVKRWFHKNDKNNLGVPIEEPWDFCGDLNLMQKAKDELGETLKQQFAWDLYRLLDPGQLICMARADQQAKAFVNTIGKWID